MSIHGLLDFWDSGLCVDTFYSFMDLDYYSDSSTSCDYELLYSRTITSSMHTFHATVDFLNVSKAVQAFPEVMLSRASRTPSR